MSDSDIGAANDDDAWPRAAESSGSFAELTAARAWVAA